MLPDNKGYFGDYGFMFDTTVFNDIIRWKIDIDKFPKNFNYFVTHIQFDQLNRTPDPNLRKKLLHIFKCMESEEIPTESVVLDVSRLGKAKLGDGKLLEELRKGNLKHTEDALIGETAIRNGLILVTDDKALRKKVNRLEGRVITLEQFRRSEYREFKDTEIGRR